MDIDNKLVKYWLKTKTGRANNIGMFLVLCFQCPKRYLINFKVSQDPYVCCVSKVRKSTQNAKYRFYPLLKVLVSWASVSSPPDYRPAHLSYTGVQHALYLPIKGCVQFTSDKTMSKYLGVLGLALRSRLYFGHLQSHTWPTITRWNIEIAVRHNQMLNMAPNTA